MVDFTCPYYTFNSNSAGNAYMMPFMNIVIERFPSINMYLSISNTLKHFQSKQMQALKCYLPSAELKTRLWMCVFVLSI